jgi:hypothetical protein
MAVTLWVNAKTGERLDRSELDAWRQRAHRFYEVNAHIFEDELEALIALGVVAATEFVAESESAGSATVPSAA